MQSMMRRTGGLDAQTRARTRAHYARTHTHTTYARTDPPLAPLLPRLCSPMAFALALAVATAFAVP